MRLVQVTVPTGKREAVLATLDDEGVDYVVTDETGDRGYAAVVTFPLPTNAVEPVLEELREAGLDEETYTVIVDAQTVLSRRFEELSERYAEEEEPERIAREEIQAKAEELAPSVPTYAVMTVISAVIATAGLLIDSPAVVVGSMVIAPLIGPAMATSVGTVVDDRDLYLEGLKLQVLGLGLAVLSAAAFAVFVRTAHLVPPGIDVTAIPEIRERIVPDFLSLVVALGAGAAGVLSLSTGISSALVGVMIAVALVPPVATVGIGIAWGLPVVVLGSAVLALVNWLSINLAAIVVLWYSGYQPANWFRLDQARADTVKRVGALAAAIVVLSVFLGGVTVASVQSATFEQRATEEVGAVLNESAHDDLVLIDTAVEYRTRVSLRRQPTALTVTVGTTTEAPPGLAGTIRERVARTTGRDVAVQVRTVGIQRA